MSFLRRSSAGIEIPNVGLSSVSVVTARLYNIYSVLYYIGINVNIYNIASPRINKGKHLRGILHH